ncbi:hypothetical protein GCM10009850_119610 [Nonomuraea monospora]|uniref:Uncharacterized protein n=1 Tax=Nonomuraea monospora TaxID=568818 RepID=A0ABN3D4K0_9ACTN
MALDEFAADGAVKGVPGGGAGRRQDAGEDGKTESGAAAAGPDGGITVFPPGDATKTRTVVKARWRYGGAVPRSLSDPPPDTCSGSDDHVVTVCWEAQCDAEQCDKPDCDPEAGYWQAMCTSGDLFIEGPAHRHDMLWALASQHERDPRIGLDVEWLPECAGIGFGDMRAVTAATPPAAGAKAAATLPERDARREAVRAIDDVQAALEVTMQKNHIVAAPPIGPERCWATATLRMVTEALHAGDTVLAAAFLDQAQPACPDGSAPEVGACIRLALQLLDAWLPGRAPGVPADLGQHVRLPAGAWMGGRQPPTSSLWPARDGRCVRPRSSSPGMAVRRFSMAAL